MDPPGMVDTAVEMHVPVAISDAVAEAERAVKGLSEASGTADIAASSSDNPKVMSDVSDEEDNGSPMFSISENQSTLAEEPREGQPIKTEKATMGKSCAEKSSEVQSDVRQPKRDTKYKTVFEVKGHGAYKVKVKKYVRKNTLHCLICDEAIAGAVSQHVPKVHGIDYIKYKRVQAALTGTDVSRGRAGRLKPISIKEAQQLAAQWKSKQKRSSLRSSPLSSKRERKKPQKDDKMTCDICGKQFRQQRYLQSHMENRHRDEPDLPAKVLQEEESHGYPGLWSKNKEMVLMLLAGNQDGEHNENSVKAEAVEGKEEQTCIICRKTLLHRQSFLRHQQETHMISITKYSDLLNLKPGQELDKAIQEILGDLSEKNLEKKKKGTPNKVKSETSEARRWFTCPACPSVLTSSGYLITHIKNTHHQMATFPQLLLKADDLISETYRKDIIEPENFLFKCPYCGRQRVGKSIKRHLRYCHEWEPDLEEQLKHIEEKYSRQMKVRETLRKKTLDRQNQQLGLQYRCRHCQTIFKHRSARSRHETFSCRSNPNRQRSYWCRVCSKHFAKKEPMQEHMRVCPNTIKNEKRFICHECGNLYHNKSALYVHKKTKHETPESRKTNYKCECGKAFYQKHHYTRHLAVHSGL